MEAVGAADHLETLSGRDRFDLGARVIGPRVEADPQARRAFERPHQPA